MNMKEVLVHILTDYMHTTARIVCPSGQLSSGSESGDKVFMSWWPKSVPNHWLAR